MSTSRVETAQSWVTLFRDALILLLALTLLLVPGCFKTILTKGGIKEADILGFKLTAAEIDQTNTSLNEARATITNLERRVDSTSRLLSLAQAQVPDPKLREEIAVLNTKNQQALANAGATQAAVGRVIQQNSDIVKKAQEAVNASGKWGVVWSGDATIKGATYEMGADVAGKLRLPNPAIFLRQGSYRSVAVVDDRDSAEAALVQAKKRRSDAYIVTMSTWCPNSVYNSQGYYECR